jgi:hypothetical protein
MIIPVLSGFLGQSTQEAIFAVRGICHGNKEITQNEDIPFVLQSLILSSSKSIVVDFTE